MFKVTEAPDIPEGEFPAVLEKVEQGTGAYGPQRKWHFLVELPARRGENGVEKPAEIVTHSEFSSANTGPKSKSYLWLKGILGRELKAGEEIDDPTGSRVLITFGRNEKGYPAIASIRKYEEPQQTLPGVPR